MRFSHRQVYRKRSSLAMTNSNRTADEDWVFGVHAVRALLDAAPAEVRRVLVAEGRRSRPVAELLSRAREAAVRVERAPVATLHRRARAAGIVAHGGVAAERHSIAPATEADLEARWADLAKPLLVILDGIQDPRNLGACLRTAEAAGADAVLLPRRRSAPLSSVVAKAASGALEHLFIVEVANLARRMDWLRARGVWLVGGVEDGGEAHTDISYGDAAAVVVGSEHKGLRRLTRQHCDHLASIPLHGATASLNVSVALGVLLFEARRQRAATPRRT